MFFDLLDEEAFRVQGSGFRGSGLSGGGKELLGLIEQNPFSLCWVRWS